MSENSCFSECYENAAKTGGALCCLAPFQQCTHTKPAFNLPRWQVVPVLRSGKCVPREGEARAAQHSFKATGYSVKQLEET